MTDPCPFCAPEPERIVFADDTLVALWSKYEVAFGHLLVVPRAHVADYFDLPAETQRALCAALPLARAAVAATYSDSGRPPPDGYNVGFNIGAAAGQTVMHAHLHVIPRVCGDVRDPRGGIRNVIPARGNYLSAQELATSPIMAELGRRAMDPAVGDSCRGPSGRCDGSCKGVPSSR